MGSAATAKRINDCLQACEGVEFLCGSDVEGIVRELVLNAGDLLAVLGTFGGANSGHSMKLWESLSKFALEVDDAETKADRGRSGDGEQ